jgi:hypothetical protein
MFALAHALAAQQNTIENVAAVGPVNRADNERLGLASAGSTGRTNGPESFEVLLAHSLQPPMITVVEQGGIILPVGLGIGATHEVNATRSPIRAAGSVPVNTVAEPFAIMPGPAGTQGISLHGSVIEVTTAAWRWLIITVAQQATMILCVTQGCGTGVGTGAAG